MSVEDLVVRLRIEEDNKLAQKDTYTPDSAKANMVEHAGSSSSWDCEAEVQGYLLTTVTKPGHRAANCKMPKRANPRQANMVNDDVDMIAMVSDVVAMISEVNLVGTNNSGWWIDTGATRHVCADKNCYFEDDIRRKKLTVDNVLYVPEIRKNLVSGWLLNKFGFHLVFESDKFVLSKNQMYVGKGYAVDAMFKLNVMVVKNDINKMNSFAYLIEFLLMCGMVDMWGEAILTATYLLNKIPRKEKEETPYELWMGRKPSYQYLRVWGCLAKVAVPTPKAQKIGPKSVDCIFIGYAKEKHAYRFYVRTGCLIRLDDKVVQDKRQRDDNDLQDERQDQTEEEEVEPRRSKRARNEKSFGPDFVSFMVENEPTSYREAVTSSEGQQWREAIKSYKWIFKKKMKADGTVDKYKARVVIQGFRQREGLDYFDTYSPLSVTRITSIRIDNCYCRIKKFGNSPNGCENGFSKWRFSRRNIYDQLRVSLAHGKEGKVGYAPTPTCARGCRKGDFWAKMGSKLLNSCEPVGPEDTNPAPKARLCVYLFDADFILMVPDYLIGPDDGEVLTHCGIQRMMNTGPTPPVNETGAPVTNSGENTHQVEPPAEGQPSNAHAVQAMEAWKHSDFLCHNYVLNGLVDSLYNVYCMTTTTKELWESLERKYKTKDAGTKKFVVARFLDYKMADSKNVISQVDAIIEKLPQSWVEFKNYLKHKQKEMSVKELVVHLCIEEDNKLAQKNTFTPDSAKANMVEHAGSSARSNSKGKGKDEKKNDKKGKGKAEYLAPKAIIRATPRQANLVNDNMDMLAIVSDVIAMISDVNLVGSNNSDWWVDTRETRHVCADKGMFHSFRAVDNGEKLYMGNSATADIKGEGDVILKMTFEKELKLTNVLYVSEIRKNLVSCLLLNKFGFRLVFESDKFGSV
ncbi:pol polyprotein [Tanacetum coccineum]